MLQVRLTVSGADAIPWTRELQATMVALLSSLTGLDTRQITVINAELQSSACSRRLLAAAPSGMRLTVDICTPAAALSATFGTLERLYTDQGSIQARTNILLLLPYLIAASAYMILSIRPSSQQLHGKNDIQYSPLLAELQHCALASNQTTISHNVGCDLAYYLCLF